MAMEIITGYTGTEHVQSADDASLNRGIIGLGNFVLKIGNELEATVINNNTIKILDGDLVIQGHLGRIRPRDYEELTISNGTPGQKRMDLIVARYTKNTDTGVESINLAVIEGTPGNYAIPPRFELNDIARGATLSEFPLYEVTLDGITLKSVTSKFQVMPTIQDLDRQAKGFDEYIPEIESLTERVDSAQMSHYMTILYPNLQRWFPLQQSSIERFTFHQGGDGRSLDLIAVRIGAQKEAYVTEIHKHDSFTVTVSENSVGIKSTFTAYGIVQFFALDEGV